MTSNLGSEHFRKLTTPLGFLAHHAEMDRVRGDIRREVERHLSPEFLERVIDERIKVPLTLRWKDAAHFRVRVDDGSVVVDALTPRAAASFNPASHLDVA
jgi:hypothetical protein